MPGCHGTDQWTLDPPGQPRDRIIPELNLRAHCPGFPRGGVLGVEGGWAQEEDCLRPGEAWSATGSSPNQDAREGLQGRWRGLQSRTKLLKMGAEPLGGGWGFREWACPQGAWLAERT